jgi:phospholipid/cholesterol/gamma-HCH transport system substrate-binding protein
VSTFVKDNRASLTSDIGKATSVTNVLTKEKEAITEIVDLTPVALVNLSLAYDPVAKTLDTSDYASQAVSSPTGPTSLLCQITKGAIPEFCAPSASAFAKTAGLSPAALPQGVTVKSLYQLLAVAP